MLFVFVRNVMLMMIGGKIADFSAYDNIPLKRYTHCVAKIICNPCTTAMQIVTSRFVPRVLKFQI